MIFYGHVYKGKMVPLDQNKLDTYLKNKPDGYEIQWDLTERDKKRTSPQNRYLHQIFKILTKEFNKMGNNFTEQKVKDLCKCKFLQYTEIDNEGTVLGENIRHTSSLSTAEMNIFIEQIKAWAAEFDIYLPDPGEQTRLETI